MVFICSIFSDSSFLFLASWLPVRLSFPHSVGFRFGEFVSVRLFIGFLLDFFVISFWDLGQKT